MADGNDPKPVSPSPLRSLADTALWAAAFRAKETERPDGLFHDPFAARLAGERGMAIAATLSEEIHQVSWAVRTYLFDQFITRQIERGVNVVINLAAGLDTRPYRMALPPSLIWIEVDLQEILEYKDDLLGDATPRCKMRRIPADLSDARTRRALFADFNHHAERILILTEGFLIYLSPEEAGAFAEDLAARPHFSHWILELVSPGVLEAQQRASGASLRAIEADYKFGPAEGPGFFSRFGWQPLDVQSVLKTAVRLNRTPFNPQLAEAIPDAPGTGEGASPWMGVCEFKNSASE